MKKNVLITSQARTGSNLLMYLLYESGFSPYLPQKDLKAGLEFFDERLDNYPKKSCGYESAVKYYKNILNSLDKDKLVLKIIDLETYKVLKHCGIKHTLAGYFIKDIFNDFETIKLTRKDKLKQAISAWFAQETNQWVWVKGEPLKEPKSINKKKIFQILKVFKNQDFLNLMTEHFKSINLTYEDLTESYSKTKYLIDKKLNISLPNQVSNYYQKIDHPIKVHAYESLSKFLINF